MSEQSGRSGPARAGATRREILAAGAGAVALVVSRPARAAFSRSFSRNTANETAATTMKASGSSSQPRCASGRKR